MDKARKNTLERRMQNNNTNGFTQEKRSPFVKPNLNQAAQVHILGPGAKRKTLRVSTLLANSSGDHHARLGEYAAQLYKEKSMTDVMVVVQDQEFKAHKAVLACYSPYFTEVLNKPGFNDIHYLQIPSVTARAFEILLEYMYTGELRVTCQELSEVYRASRRLGVKGALKRCVELLQVSPENFQNMVYLYVTARKLDLLDASVRGFKLMVLHFERLITTKEFLDLEIHQVVELFKTDEIGARSEVIVFLAALKWLNYDYLEREEHVEEIFKCIRFSLMSMQEILACYHPPLLPGLMKRPDIRETLLNATCYITAKSLGQESLFVELANKPRTFLFAGEPMVLWDVTVFDPEKFEVTRRHQAATKLQAMFRGYITRKWVAEYLLRIHYAATIIQAAFRGYRVRKTMKKSKWVMKRKGRSPKCYLFRKDSRSGLLKTYSKRTFELLDTEVKPDQHIVMYVMGAFDARKEEEGVNAILTFEPTSGSWNFVTKCLSPRHDARMVFLDGFLYIVGGYNPMHRSDTGLMLPLKECHRFHRESGEWRELPPMNMARSAHAAVLFNRQVLAIGGKDEQNRILSSIEKFDLSVGRWKEFSPSLPEPRMAMGVTIFKGMLWVAGGITNEGRSICLLDSVWCLDNKTCRWTKKSSLPLALAFATLISDREHLFCAGGATRPLSYERDELDSTDKIYHFERGRWVEQMSMPMQCHNTVGCNDGKRLYLLGGFSSHSLTHILHPVTVDLEEEKAEQFGKVPKEAAGFVAEATVTWQ